LSSNGSEALEKVGSRTLVKEHVECGARNQEPQQHAETDPAYTPDYWGCQENSCGPGSGPLVQAVKQNLDARLEILCSSLIRRRLIHTTNGNVCKIPISAYHVTEFINHQERNSDHALAHDINPIWRDAIRS